MSSIKKLLQTLAAIGSILITGCASVPTECGTVDKVISIPHSLPFAGGDYSFSITKQCPDAESE